MSSLVFSAGGFVLVGLNNNNNNNKPASWIIFVHAEKTA